MLSNLTKFNFGKINRITIDHINICIECTYVYYWLPNDQYVDVHIRGERHWDNQTRTQYYDEGAELFIQIK